MKIIDLLNKIANGEEDDLTTEFEFDKQVWNFYKFKKESGFCLDGWLLNQNITITKHKEIIEEEKKIPEKIPYHFSLDYIHCNINETAKEEIDKTINCIYDKINEIIDYLKSKGDK